MPRNSNKRTTSKWTSAEDSALRRLVQKYGEKAWAQIARELPNRLGKQCRERWRNQLDPSIIRSPFTPQEDERVIQMVKTNGTTWARIAEALPGRTENMIKNRYYANLIKRMGDMKKSRPISSGQRSSGAAARHTSSRRSRGGRPQYDSESESESLSLSESEDEILPKKRRQADSEEDDSESVEEDQDMEDEEEPDEDEEDDDDDEHDKPDVPNTPAFSESAPDHHVLATPMGETPQDAECNLKRIDKIDLGKARIRNRASLLQAWLAPESSTSSTPAPSNFLNSFTPSLQPFDAPDSVVKQRWQARLTSDMDRAVAQLQQQWRHALASDPMSLVNDQVHLPPFRTVAPTLSVLGVEMGEEPDLLSAQTLCEMHHNDNTTNTQHSEIFDDEMIQSTPNQVEPAEHQCNKVTAKTIPVFSPQASSPRMNEWDRFLDHSKIAA